MSDEASVLLDYEAAATSAGLSYADTDTPGISRRRAGKGFSYAHSSGRRVTEAATLKRIKALVIPPAWTEVWVCPDPNGHIQAYGEDERGRRQYRYHAAFREAREGAKFDHITAFAEALPRLRRQIAKDMATPGLGRRKVVATVAHLLETTMIRVGNAEYARTNKSFGLTTLRTRHVALEGSDLRFHFKGKGGKAWQLQVHDRRVARVVRLCQELPGQHLFQYVDDEGQRQQVTSTDVNAYLKEASGSEITAKDFRTWTGTVLAATTLTRLGPAESAIAAKRALAGAIRETAERLGNTPTICRKCYVHPEVMTSYLEGALALDVGDDDEPPTDSADLSPAETAVLAFLQRRSGQALAA